MARKIEKKAPGAKKRGMSSGGLRQRAAIATRTGRGRSRSLRKDGIPEHFEDVVMARELFWNNVIREILTALSTLVVASTDAAAEGVALNPDGTQPSDPLDGRLAIVTTAGERIPIAEVYPLFACGIPGSESERALSVAVECTVFQVGTPAGEVYTLPLHEIRGFHALTQDLMNEISQAASGANSGSGEPFGFAAFTELSRSRGLSKGGDSSNEIADVVRGAKPLGKK